MSSVQTAALAAELAALAKKYASKQFRKWASADAKDRGEFRGRGSYRKLPEKDMYRMTLDPDDPLRLFGYETGHEYRAPFSLDCDFGSIPESVRPVSADGLLKLGPLDFWRSYGLHDAGYRDGGLFIRDPAGSLEWTFVALDRVHVDVVLLWGLTAEGANNATLQAVYRAVRLGAGIPWRRHRAGDA